MIKLTKKNLFITLLVTVVILSIIVIQLASRVVTTNDYDELFILEPGFDGCVYIHYNQVGNEELQVTNDRIVYKVPADGRIYTSSTSNFGELGWHSIYVQYEDNPENRLDVSSSVKSGITGSGEKETRWYNFFNKNYSCVGL